MLKVQYSVKNKHTHNNAKMKGKNAFYLFSFNVCLFLKERESRGGAEREGDRGSEGGSVLTAGSPMRGSNSRTTRS